MLLIQSLIDFLFRYFLVYISIIGNFYIFFFDTVADVVFYLFFLVNIEFVVSILDWLRLGACPIYRVIQFWDLVFSLTQHIPIHFGCLLDLFGWIFNLLLILPHEPEALPIESFGRFHFNQILMLFSLFMLSIFKFSLL